MHIIMQPYRIDDGVSYKILNIVECCNKILHDNMINLQVDQFDNTYNFIPAVCIIERDKYWCDDDYIENTINHKINYLYFYLY